MKGIVGGIATGFVIIVLIVFGFKCTERVPAGYVGVVYNMNGGIEKDVLRQGWKLVSPTKTITLYSIALEQSYMTKDDVGDSPNDESFEIPTKEGASLETDVAFSYSFDEERVPEVFTRFRGQDGKEILNSFIKPKMQAWIKEETPAFSMIDIVSKQRGQVNATITERMQERFSKYGIVIDNVALADIRPDKDTDKAIKKKIKAQEELETAKVTAETDKVNAERDKAVALINAEKEKEAAAIEAEKAKIKAEGAAAARETESKAEAEAIKIISGALTDEYNEYIYYKTWNGAMPQITGGATPIVDMRDKE
jgi:regulator of protease activity HflC (stomatin/prohibitin superfamily)